MITYFPNKVPKCLLTGTCEEKGAVPSGTWAYNGAIHKGEVQTENGLYCTWADPREEKT